MSLYRHILKQAAQITWRHKFLWFFGFFAAFLGGFGEYQIFLNRADAYFVEDLFVRLKRFQELGVFSGEFWGNAGRAFQLDPVSGTIVLVVMLILLALLVFLIWLGVVSQVGIVFSTAQLTKSKKDSSKLDLRKGVEEGTRYFWPVFGLNVISKLLIFLFFFCLSLVFIFMVPQDGGLAVNLLYMAVFIVFLVIALIAAFVFKYAACYVVVEERKFLDSIERGWKLFLNNWLITLEMALILFFITFGATLVILFLGLVITIPIYLFIELLVLMGVTNLGFWVIMAAIFLLTVFIAIAGGILSAFQISSWTTLFLRLTTQKKNLSKLVRWAGGK